MMEEKVREALVRELLRQAEERQRELSVEVRDGKASVDGLIDIDALAMAVVGSVAGGP